MRRRWRCWVETKHEIQVYGPTSIPDVFVVRCYCGRGVRPRLVRRKSV